MPFSLTRTELQVNILPQVFKRLSHFGDYKNLVALQLVMMTSYCTLDPRHASCYRFLWRAMQPTSLYTASLTATCQLQRATTKNEENKWEWIDQRGFYIWNDE